ncbi:inositol-pentakisphosphate 2-kinase-like isoform X1 [Apium graveolens]|uniref:inositol-pentakisphosphate 2-kinase-like isoform X1 n=2 Tax=Apium graveolens TaxID=4045 RepID=UPI003D7BEB80
MEMILEARDAGEWAYRGEGAANLVLSYTGSYPPFVGKVLRVRKITENGAEYDNGLSGLSKHECLLWDELISAPSREMAEHLYVKNVMRPLLGSDYVESGVRVLVGKGFLESVESNILSKRPSWRVNDAKTNTECVSALLLPDLSHFPGSVLNKEFCITVEIKPKCGFLPVSDLIAEENSVKKSISRFKMHQALKFHQGKISEVSEYDPLDLFSKSIKRVNKAVKDLFLTPQNNFRVFLNGSLIYGGLGGSPSSKSYLTRETFEDVLKCVIQSDNGNRTTKFLDLVAETVFRSRLLDRLLKAQMLDTLDIEGAIHAYYNVVSQSCKVCSKFREVEEKLSERYSHIHSDPYSKSLKIVKDYLTAATAKDLSTMISFRPTENRDMESLDDTVVLKSTRQSFQYKASFLDLDRKPLTKMEYYYELDQKIVRAYSQISKVKDNPVVVA